MSEGKTGRGEFFAIDRRTWARVCSLGLNAAVAYLVMARGTGHDNLVSSWSTDAVTRYTGLGRRKAKAGVERVVSSKMVERSGTEKHPRYRLQTAAQVAYRVDVGSTSVRDAALTAAVGGQELSGKLLSSAKEMAGKGVLVQTGSRIFGAAPQDWIWLPNEFVTGAADEVPPLERLRQTQEVMALRLAVDLYHAQNLREDGGVSREIVWRTYHRRELGQQGEMVVYGFAFDSGWVGWDNEVTVPHRRPKDELTDEERKAGKNSAIDYFRRENLLLDTGVLEWVPHLCEGDSAEAEIIHPLRWDGEDGIESALGAAADRAGEAMLSEGQASWARSQGLKLVPVPRHMRNVQVIGIARLRYRPRTALTSAWWADLQGKGERHLERYKAQLERATTGMRAAS